MNRLKKCPACGRNQYTPKDKAERPIVRWTGDEREIICPACKNYICYPEDIKTINLKYRQFCGVCGQKLNWN